ncbi:MAG: prepilin-type N-terminal cleavage/methylation domain-containing protein [Planctomycetota bacterium]
MTSTPHGTRQQDGFTLMEAVVALAIVAMVVISYLGIRTKALADGIEARNWRLAREIAEERLSELLAGAHETPPQSGVSISLDEKYPRFSYQIVVGESSIADMEASLLSAEIDEGNERDRSEWQQNRDLFRKASARGMSAFEYQDQIAAEEYERRVSSKAPSEDDFEEVAVFVLFPKIDPQYEGQQESYVIKSKVSTLALSGLTPEQARQIAEAQGSSDAAADPGALGGAAAGSNPFGGGK